MDHDVSIAVSGTVELYRYGRLGVRARFALRSGVLELVPVGGVQARLLGARPVEVAVASLTRLELSSGGGHLLLDAAQPVSVGGPGAAGLAAALAAVGVPGLDAADAGLPADTRGGLRFVGSYSWVRGPVAHPVAVALSRSRLVLVPSSTVDWLVGVRPLVRPIDSMSVVERTGDESVALRFSDGPAVELRGAEVRSLAASVGAAWAAGLPASAPRLPGTFPAVRMVPDGGVSRGTLHVGGDGAAAFALPGQAEGTPLDPARLQQALVQVDPEESALRLVGGGEDAVFHLPGGRAGVVEWSLWASVLPRLPVDDGPPADAAALRPALGNVDGVRVRWGLMREEVVVRPAHVLLVGGRLRVLSPGQIRGLPAVGTRVAVEFFSPRGVLRAGSVLSGSGVTTSAEVPRKAGGALAAAVDPAYLDVSVPPLATLSFVPNKRQHHRLEWEDGDDRAPAVVLRRGGEPLPDARLLDLSLSGCRVAVAVPLVPGETVEVCLDLPYVPEPLAAEVLSAVADTGVESPIWRCGLRFVEQAESLRSRLQKEVLRLEAERQRPGEPSVAERPVRVQAGRNRSTRPGAR